MCRSLESFVIWDDNSRRNSHDRNLSIFLLRHFPRLQILNLNFYELNAAIQLLASMPRSPTQTVLQVTEITRHGLLNLKSTKNHLRTFLYYFFFQDKLSSPYLFDKSSAIAFNLIIFVVQEHSI